MGPEGQFFENPEILTNSNNKNCQENRYPLSSSTQSLQSNPLQIPGGSRERDGRTNKEKDTQTENIASIIGFIEFNYIHIMKAHFFLLLFSLNFG